MLTFIKKRVVGLAILVALVAIYSYKLGQDFDKVAEMSQRERELKQEIASLRVELGRLEDYYEMSKTPEFVERMAREKLGMVKRNEIIYYIQHRYADPNGE